jgi:tRNA dimethylallyltransferase
MADHALVITGATATGKTALAVEVARRLGGEIISMDSRQVYRGMDIGTAKPALPERGGIAHHGFDLVDPSERYSAGRFGRDARRWIAEIRGRGHVPVLAGGTGFFLKALTAPFFAEPPMDSTRREALKGLLARWPTEELARWCAALDPAALERAGGRQRLARAIEVAVLTGRPLPWWHRHAPPDEPPLDVLVVVLELPRAELYARVDARVGAMERAGLVEEVRGLVRSGYSAADPGMNATGYIELLPFLAGEYSLDDALDRVRQATRRYARRQMTWFRHQLPPEAVRLDARRPIPELAAEVALLWQGEGPT